MHLSIPPERLSGTLAALYDAALDPLLWPVALTALATLFHAAFADRFTRTHDRSTQAGTAIGLDDDDYQQQFLGVWSRRNVWSLRRPVERAGEILTTRDILPIEELRRSEMFTDYLRPRDLHDGLRFATWSDAAGIEDISLLRPSTIGAYRPEERHLAAILMPHLRRVAALSRRLAAAEGKAAQCRAALDAVPQPIMLLDDRGEIVHANPRAEAALATENALGPAAPLRRALQAAVQRGRPRLPATLRLPIRAGTTLTVLPLPETAANGATALAVLDGATLSPRTVQDRMVERYRMTAAEAKIVAGLAAGETVAAIAARTSRSVNTIRSHLAHAMGKTGTARQSDLVRLALTLA